MWSPDGTRIVFSGDGILPGVFPNPNREIFVMEYPSLAITQITEHAAIDESPAWSADGSQITFASNREVTYTLYVIAAPPVAAPPVAGLSSLAVPWTVSNNVSTQAEATVYKLNPTTDQETDPFSVHRGNTPPATNYTLTVSMGGRARGT